jgi:hypothetical protein
MIAQMKNFWKKMIYPDNKEFDFLNFNALNGKSLKRAIFSASLLFSKALEKSTLSCCCCCMAGLKFLNNPKSVGE